MRQRMRFHHPYAIVYRHPTRAKHQNLPEESDFLYLLSARAGELLEAKEAFRALSNQWSILGAKEFRLIDMNARKVEILDEYNYQPPESNQPVLPIRLFLQR